MPIYNNFNRNAPCRALRIPEGKPSCACDGTGNGYHPVAKQIRSVLARFRNLTDRQILARDCKLSDAQELVARKCGFETWLAMKKGVEGMTASAAEIITSPALLAAEPQLFVASIQEACDFHVGNLGFQVAFSYGEPPFYAQVVRDRARLTVC